MKNIKIIPKKRIKSFKSFKAEQILKNLDTENSFEESNKKKKKKNKKNQIIYFNKPQTIYARGIDLEEVELKIQYITILHHPEVRTKIAICSF